MLPRLAAAALLLVLALGAALVVLRGHPAAEHTRAFRDEDKAGRAILAAVRGAATLDEAARALGDRRAWITVHEGASRRTVAFADAAQIVPPARGAPRGAALLQVDVAIDAPWGARVVGPLALGVDAGLDGVTLASGEVVPPGVLLARGLGRFELARFVAAEGATLGLRTYALVETKGGPKRLLLGALLPEPRVDADRLVRAASLGGTYLAAHIRKDNRYDYEIDASNGKASPGYNAVRHAGTTYALLQLYRQQGLLAASTGSAAPADPAVLATADQGIAWLVEKTRDDPADPSRAFQIDGKKIKLGGGALTLMAFVERLHVTEPAPPPALEAKAAQLARYLVSQQDEEGRFASYYAPTKDFEPDARDSIYYPGEAALALARYAALEAARGRDGGAWRAAAEKGARFLVDERHTALGVRVRMPVDAWLLLAIELLDRTGKYAEGDALLRHADRITRQIMREQYLDDDAVPLPMRGARTDTDFGSLVSTGSRMEALGAAAALEARHAPTQSRVRDAAIANAAYGMRFQFDEDRLFLTSPKARALGGVPNSVSDPRVRIDGVQHNLSGWLLLAAVLRHSELP